MLEHFKRIMRTSPGLASRIHQMRFRRQTGAQGLNAGYDREIVEVMGRVLRPDSCCIDVGAHQGTILKAMVQISPAGRHVAFEPLPDLAAALRRDFPGVTIVQAAVSDYTGTTSFVHVENDPAYSGLRQRIYDRPDPVLKMLPVDVVTLDAAAGDRRVEFIKLDIEGGEFHALRGAVHLVRRCRPVIVFEAGGKSTGQYGIEPETIHRFVLGDLACHLSTMQRWLADRSPYTEAEFCDNWHNGPDFCFIAYPAAAVV